MQYKSQKFPNINERSLRSPLYFYKKKCHVERKSKNFTALANIIVAQLNGRIYMIFFRMCQDCLRAFRISRRSFYFHQRACPFISNYKRTAHNSILQKQRRIFL